MIAIEAAPLLIGIIAALATIISTVVILLASIGKSVRVAGIELGVTTPTRTIATKLERASARLGEASQILQEAEEARSSLATTISRLRSEQETIQAFVEADESKEILDILRGLQRRPFWVDVAFLLISIAGGGTVGALLGAALTR